MTGVNRRSFVMGASTALAATRAAGAAGRLGIGMIGCGRRGLLKEVLQFARECNVEVVALGGICRWKDKRTAPDSVECVLEYPEGFLVRYNTTFGNSANNYLKFIGTRGVLDASRWNWNQPSTISGEGSGEQDRLPPGAELPRLESTPHMKNWLECLRTRQPPMAPIDAGYTHSVAVIMADEALLRGRRMVFDPARRAIREG